jgi:hypothetical protein
MRTRECARVRDFASLRAYTKYEVRRQRALAREGEKQRE